MSTPDIPIPVNIQEDLISDNLNSSMLLNFLMGIYTVVYGGTMYLYLSKKPANLNRCFVLSAVSALYFLCVLFFIVEWYYLDWTLVIHGDTRESIFLGTVGESPQWIWVLSDFLENSMLIISDGLLIWRCYHVWGQSFWVIWAPLILLVTEFGLFVATTVLSVRFSQITSDTNAVLFNNIISALVFVSLGTTVITTFFIGYRIYSVSILNRSPSKKLFNRIAVMIIESAAAYSLVLLFDAIIFVLTSHAVMGSTMDEADYYVQTVLTVAKGMAPTILVARIATNENHTVASSTMTHISGLQFGSQKESGGSHSGNATGGDINVSVHIDDADLTSVIEAERKSSVDALSGDNQV